MVLSADGMAPNWLLQRVRVFESRLPFYQRIEWEILSVDLRWLFSYCKIQNDEDTRSWIVRNHENWPPTLLSQKVKDCPTNCLNLLFIQFGVHRKGYDLFDQLIGHCKIRFVVFVALISLLRMKRNRIIHPARNALILQVLHECISVRTNQSKCVLMKNVRIAIANYFGGDDTAMVWKKLWIAYRRPFSSFIIIVEDFRCTTV